MTDQPLKKYRGNCHCGAFVYEVKVPEIKEVYECNCSICYKKGYLLVLVADYASNYEVVKGSEDQLTNYTFGEGKFDHKFCGECGTGVLCRSKTSLAVNAHAIQDMNTWELKTKQFDGASKGEPHQAPVHKGELPAVQVEGGVTYTGSCHCGKLTLAVNTKPIDETYEMSVFVCNCSVCERLGAVWIYPPPDQVVLAGDARDIGARKFNSYTLSKTFCRACGVPMTNEGLVLVSPYIDGRAEARGGAVSRWPTHPVNLRVLDDRSVDLGKLTITQGDGASFKPAYVNP